MKTLYYVPGLARSLPRSLLSRDWGAHQCQVGKGTESHANKIKPLLWDQGSREEASRRQVSFVFLNHHSSGRGRTE